jgi:hypothetical protein
MTAVVTDLHGELKTENRKGLNNERYHHNDGTEL